MEENIPEWTPPCDSMPWYITAFQSSPVRICTEKFEREEGVTQREDRAEMVRGAGQLDATQDRSPEGNASHLCHQPPCRGGRSLIPTHSPLPPSKASDFSPFLSPAEMRSPAASTPFTRFTQEGFAQSSPQHTHFIYTF